MKKDTRGREGKAPESVLMGVCESRKVFKKGALCEETRHILVVFADGRRKRRDRGRLAASNGGHRVSRNDKSLAFKSRH